MTPDEICTKYSLQEEDKLKIKTIAQTFSFDEIDFALETLPNTIISSESYESIQIEYDSPQAVITYLMKLPHQQAEAKRMLACKYQSLYLFVHEKQQYPKIFVEVLDLLYQAYNYSSQTDSTFKLAKDNLIDLLTQCTSAEFYSLCRRLTENKKAELSYQLGIRLPDQHNDFLTSGEPDRGSELLQVAANLNQIDALFVLIEREEDLDKKFQRFSQAIHFGQTKKIAALLKNMFDQTKKLPLQALGLLGQIINQDNPETDVLITIAEIYEDLGQHDLAMASLEKVWTLDSAPLAMLPLAERYFQNSKTILDALKLYEKTVNTLTYSEHPALGKTMKDLVLKSDQIYKTLMQQHQFDNEMLKTFIAEGSFIRRIFKEWNAQDKGLFKTNYLQKIANHIQKIEKPTSEKPILKESTAEDALYQTGGMFEL